MVSTRSSSAAVTPRAPKSESPAPPSTTTPTTTAKPTRQSRAAATPATTTTTTTTVAVSAPGAAWSHVPRWSTLAWLAVSLPLVIWDTGYVLLRPLSMPGGSLHWPLWVPYALYGEVDHMYGFKQWNAGNGFTSAQGFLNAVETLMYLAYVGLWYRHGQVLPAGAAAGQRAQERAVAGRAGALAVVVGYSAAVMTLSKTVLYWMNEYFSGFDNIGHNDLFRLVFCFIIPNGLWLLYPSYMIYDMGSEIVSALGGSPSRAKTE